MANPNQRGHPDTYKGTLWYTGTGDNGGVHINSGVQNFWFYILSEGGKGTNDFSKVYSVDSLGIAKAEKIAYRNLTTYLSRNSQYSDARFFAIQSAIDLYGNCSKEVIATTNAWYAVGVGDAFDSGLVKAGFSSDTFQCKAPFKVDFTNLSFNSNSYKWFFGTGDSSVVNSPTYTYPNYGKFNVTLIAKSCFTSKNDTLKKPFYIEIDSTKDICNALLMPIGKWQTIKNCTGF